ncbi:hypothetical protein F8O07_07145 [Pseudoclavibacter sp. CFCC 13796]|uniref:hypothetical protein n=1 Tax=Pseudoclavibacter sp. CFCC 13796 TaxID=2615179 RepID=UPI0013016861|nr:hypothetical protein [Pseudoclavibacter sp. CFCC 13796]KAB1661673.1 hypothetical protein F8O07_07145 [Pseudoclavibacter sp. CFCC 13796]
MNPFDPTQHPRGNQSTGHAGQFAAKTQTSSEVSLTTLEQEREAFRQHRRESYRDAFVHARSQLDSARNAYTGVLLTEMHPDIRSVSVSHDHNGNVTSITAYRTAGRNERHIVAQADTPAAFFDRIGITDAEERRFLANSPMFMGAQDMVQKMFTVSVDRAPGENSIRTQESTILDASQSTGSEIVFPDEQRLSITAWMGRDASPVIAIDTGWGEQGTGNVRVAMNDNDIFNCNPETDEYSGDEEKYRHLCEVAGVDPDDS